MSEINPMKVKWAWIARQSKKGWHVKLSVDRKRDIPLAGLLFATEQDVKKVCRGSIVFIHRRVIETRRRTFSR